LTQQAHAGAPWAPIGTGLPDPEEQPLMRIPEAGRKAYGLSRAASYAAAARGEIPTIRQGRRKLVPTAKLRRMLGMDGGDSHVPAA
jgi:hypothetical protein